ncbi:MAG: hypothetical protein A3B91_01990 [Candidatus Yanofskybacteria bacterium RIFCSPHIGHO2_02_FULL_41_29]|uniref:Uncharacterized protein n=1 Tax=Candidatus Yanofskybacteria bacterium RIFCSPHIGHO2_01_FULL_41_53 TaxID=1802663 RepID=A0A1F8EHJ8_9BACT|nr:MAG: hypothetical protein A2650_04190 [Candidatus Yanofskybacteria bacterium RIFCSPHIGHO2_01_FULL_41_53]OGN11231.1 MAG: hypothetical protein A3B91_01990 [Candidatus Yanofskybacteria bacterium RIFCSPHIGHO2_02_FULL_41_29]OGN18744.1 MAG: hypothetical protein A3F48_01580 [Candidatus Yanofskybacteria bacterium RIFCSPHIGHO2_12_FULL_41_9]OGN23551.1 MAG: hypothetical protein A2916_01425 [Candidatus Yanofskybacteria bacterium RIFCSPLOWO2_01_FULL_41_67]OGN28393.1 MAG: hypothetical protein A3H54_02755 
MAEKGTFTTEDLKLAIQLGKRVFESKFGQLKGNLVQNVREAIDPDLRLAGRVKARYDALREAGFSHEEAVEYTSKSVNKTADTVLNSLSKTKEETCR